MRYSSLRHRASPASSYWFGGWDRLDPWILLPAGPVCQGAPPRVVKAFGMMVAVLAALPFLACASRNQAAAATVPALDEQAGTIRRVGTFGFAIVPDRDPGTRYAPDRPFPPQFQLDGLRVLFSGTEIEAPEGVRLWGTPFRLATLRRAGP